MILGLCQPYAEHRYSSTCRQDQIMWYSVQMAQIGRRTAEAQEDLVKKIKHLMLSGAHYTEIASVVDLKPDTVRKYITQIRKQWVEEGIGKAESKAELLERANLIAKMAAQGHTDAKKNSFNGQVAFLKLQLEVLDRIAKLTGAYEPEKTELTGPGGGPIQMQMTDHVIDALAADDLAKRLRNWADALEEVTDGQQDVPAVVEGTSKNI